jgi:hypothetical protein
MNEEIDNQSSIQKESKDLALKCDSGQYSISLLREKANESNHTSPTLPLLVQ